MTIAAAVTADNTTASAVAAGTYSAPVWLPLRGDHLIGCSYNSPGALCGDGHYHSYWAIDMKAARDESVYAAGAGEVIKVVKNQTDNCNANIVTSPALCPDGAKGNSVLIDHGGGIYSYYQHFHTISVVEHQWVDQNTPLGGAGDSGYATPGFNHVHFERRNLDGTTKFDPGPLKACVGATLTSYPQAFPGNPTSWQGLAPERYTAHSDGTGCGSPLSTPSGKPKVDIVFVIDTTGSMGPYISGVKAAATSIAADLFATADARVALVDYKDFYSCSTDGYAARVDLAFSTDVAAFNTAVGGLSAAGGCDTPESVYSGMMTAIGLPWRSGVSKGLIVMGDAAPKDPEPGTGFTRHSVAAAAIAVDPAAISSVNIQGGAGPLFAGLAADTGGTSTVATDPTTAVAQIVAAITAIKSATVIDFGGPYGGAVGAPVTFNAVAFPPDGVSVTGYEWDYDNDGVYDETTTLATTSHTYPGIYTGLATVRATTSSSPAQKALATASVSIVAAYPVPTSTPVYRSVVPERLLDTRPGPEQKGYTGPKPTPGQTIELTVTGMGATNIPADAAAVVLNVTGADPTGDGFVTVWPCGDPQPLASNLNLHVGSISPNLVIVKVGGAGKVCLFTAAGANLIADVNGWFPADDRYTSVTPERLLDTRPGPEQKGYTGPQPVAGQTVELTVAYAGTTNVPGYASAVVLNVTGVDPTGDGFVTVWPCGDPQPLASNLNLHVGSISPNLVTVKVGGTGKVCLFTATGAHLIADINGWFAPVSALAPE